MSSTPEKNPDEALSEALQKMISSLPEKTISEEEVHKRAEEIMKQLEAEEPLRVQPADYLDQIEQLLNKHEKTFQELYAINQDTALTRKQAVGTYQSSLDNLVDALNKYTMQLKANWLEMETPLNDLRQSLQTSLNHVQTILSRLDDNIEQSLKNNDYLSREVKTTVQYIDAANQAIANSVTNANNLAATSFDSVRQFAQSSHIPPPPRSKKADALHLAEIQGSRNELSKQHQTVHNQARISFAVAISLLILGVLIVFAGIICIYTINIAAGTITAISGTVINLLSGLILGFNKQTNDRLDAISNNLSNLAAAEQVMWYISQISDKKKRDEAIADLAKQLYPSPHTRP